MATTKQENRAPLSCARTWGRRWLLLYSRDIIAGSNHQSAVIPLYHCWSVSSAGSDDGAGHHCRLKPSVSSDDPYITVG